MHPVLKHLARCGCLLAAMTLAAADTRAQNPLSLTATFSAPARAKLVLSTTTLTFPNADPETVAQISPQQGATTVTAKVRLTSGTTASLTVLATGDLLSGINSIPIAALKWTTPNTPPFVGGIMATTAQPMGTFGASGTYTGAISFTLDNSWTYVTGDYSTTVVYTLSVP